MANEEIPVLHIDEEFKTLIRPLRRQEYLQLEANILADGCRDPLIVWEGIILDGHNRYQICHRHRIPFTYKEMAFDCREAAIAWTCANQLGRRNITEETRKFLIGKQYESEKKAKSIRTRGHNQYTDENLPVEQMDISLQRTCDRIADENHISHGTVEKYAIYSRALEEIGKTEPDFIPKVLGGRCKISHKNIIELSRLSPEDMSQVIRKIERTQEPYVQYQVTRHAMSPATLAPTSVKDMPVFDPDAEVTELSLTLPSWSESIDRVLNHANFKTVSATAKSNLTDVLYDLEDRITAILSALKED